MPCIQGIRILAWYTYGNYNTRIILHRCYSAIKKRIIRYSSHWFAEAEQASENAFYSRKRHRTRARARSPRLPVYVSLIARETLSRAALRLLSRNVSQQSLRLPSLFASEIASFFVVISGHLEKKRPFFSSFSRLLRASPSVTALRQEEGEA